MGNLGVWLLDRSGELLPKGQTIAFSLAQWMGGEEAAMSLLEAQCTKWGTYANGEGAVVAHGGASTT